MTTNPDYCRCAVESAGDRWTFGEATGEKVDCHVPGTVQLKDEELVWYLEFGGQQLLWTVLILILTLLRQISNWCRQNSACWLTPTVNEYWWSMMRGDFAATPFFLVAYHCKFSCLWYWPDCKPEGPLFSAEFVCVSVCLCGSDRHFYPSTLTDFDETY